jgi:hypothetical protein
MLVALTEKGKFSMRIAISFLALLACVSTAIAQEPPVHGLWVWKTPIILDLPARAEALRAFCRKERINEVYLSFSSQNGGAAEQQEIQKLIALLHKSHIRVEALLLSTDADEPGKHRDQLMAHVSEVISFNREHAKDRFDGIHLDIEPQQRQENQGPGNLAFLPNLLDTYRGVRTVAEQNQMTVNADIPNEYLNGNLDQRRALMSALPRVTLMLFELNNPNDGQTSAAQADKLRQASESYLQMAYQGLSGDNVAKLAIGLNTPDYGQQLTAMLKVVQDTLNTNPNYLGWAWHSYNDVAQLSN